MKTQITFGNLEIETTNTLTMLDEKKACKRLFDKDASLWKNEPEHVKSINNRLGWLQLPESFLETADALKEFSKQMKKEGFKYAVLLGMGGSSLCSEVARETFGAKKGYLELLVLDNTDPAAIHDIEKQINIQKTLFIVASKSGSTKESTFFCRYFYDLLDKKTKGKAGDNFVAITDDGTPLVKMAEEYKFRKVFVNPGDIGGRYSVLSFFGLLPMALMGIDIKALLKGAQKIQNNCNPSVPSLANPAVSLGALLGTGGNYGRDKVTFVLSKSISAFGYWVEQLIAESTGKEGKGLIPVSGEECGKPDVYGKDRIFVHIYLDKDNNTSDIKKLAALEKAGSPVVRIKLADKLALGGEYYRWELTTAIAGAVIGINPFDEPNVAESKKNTDHLLDEWQKKGAFSKSTPLLEAGNISVYAGDSTSSLLKDNKSVGDLLKAFTASAKPGDYIAMLPYFLKTNKREKILQAWRMDLRNNLRVATTLLNGPRYLHSTGQLHKGGPANGLYILFTGEEEALPIPGEKFGFDILNHAQALGDFRSLNDHGRRVIRIHLGKNIDKGLKELMEAIKKSGKK